MRVFVLALASLSLVGCATKYQEMGLTGGVAAQQITADTWRILARGNAYTSGTRVQDFVLMKAAETTKAAGGTHFIIASSQDATRNRAIVTPPSASTTYGGGYAVTTFNPGVVYNIVKPGQTVYVRVLKIPPATPPPPGAISADEIIQYVGPRLQS